MKKHTRLNDVINVCACCGDLIRTTDFDRVRLSHRLDWSTLCDDCLEEDEDEYTLLLRVELHIPTRPRARRLA